MAGLRGASKPGKGTGVMNVGAKVSKSGVAGTNRMKRLVKPYPLNSRGPKG